MADVRTSIVIPALNRAWCIRDAMESALAAMAPDDEIIAVDDGSTDGTLGILNEYAHQRPQQVRVLRHPDGGNRGIAPTRNLGIIAARGRYVVFLDSDDLFEPARLADAPTWLDERPEMLAAIEPYRTASFENGAHTAVEFHLTRRQLATRSDMLKAMLYESIYWNTPSITIRRSAFGAVGLFDASFPYGEDTALWLRLAATGKVGIVQRNEPKAIVRRHADHSWDPGRPVIGQRVHLRGLATALRWARSQGDDVPRSSVDLLRQRLSDFVREISSDPALPARFRLEAWARALAAAPAIAFNWTINANVARMIVPRWRRPSAVSAPERTAPRHD